MRTSRCRLENSDTLVKMEGIPQQTLFICKEVDLYVIPPRTSAGGYKSGDWRVDKRIFTGRLKVVAKGPNLDVLLEDPSTSEVFAVCPVPRGQRHVAVEAATDSSRNFVLRVEDSETKRHAFLGLSFSERSQAFDFNVALTDHEKYLQREEAATKPSPSPEMAALYKKTELKLDEGQTMKIEVKKKESIGGSSFLNTLGNNKIPLGGLTLAQPPPPATSDSNKIQEEAADWATFE